MIEPVQHGWLATWKAHGVDYAIEAMLLGCFMISACCVVAAIQHPASPVATLATSPFIKRAMIGAMMGLTALVLVTSPLGKRSGAHLNPALTLAMLWMGRTTVPNALGYIAGQFSGGLAGVAVAAVMLGPAIAAPEVNYVVTMPGMAGAVVAWIVEFSLAATMLVVVLTVSSIPGWARRTPYVAATLVFLFITFAAPFSGMSINPARSFASAVPAGAWNDLWIYFSAPVAGMFSGVLLHRLATRSPHSRACCKGGRCTSCRCMFTCYRLHFDQGDPGRQMSGGEAA